MRTKTLLIAAAALAVGTISSEAQVYSQNIVGYANIKINGGQYNLLAIPFNSGVSNGMNELFSTLPDGTYLNRWNGTSYDANEYDGGTWYNGDESDTADTPALFAGEGFFLLPPDGQTFTNTFAGTVALLAGTTNVMTVAGGQYSLIGCVLPLYGPVDSAAINMQMPDGSYLNRWNGNSFDANEYDGGTWYNGDESDTAPTPIITVGQGYFVLPGDTWHWTNSLPAN